MADGCYTAPAAHPAVHLVRSDTPSGSNAPVVAAILGSLMSVSSPTDMSSSTPAAASSPPPGRRLRVLLQHPERSAALLAILIGFASIMSAVIAWRASLASIDASRYDSLPVQQQARRQQIERA